jgi:L-histidine Nalpha-methyltransferase
VTGSSSRSTSSSPRLSSRPAITTRSAFARFRLNHLTHLDRRFGLALDLGAFDARAHYDAPSRTVEGHLVAREAQEVPVPGLGLTLDLPLGGAD